MLCKVKPQTQSVVVFEKKLDKKSIFAVKSVRRLSCCFGLLRRYALWGGYLSLRGCHTVGYTVVARCAAIVSSSFVIASSFSWGDDAWVLTTSDDVQLVDSRGWLARERCVGCARQGSVSRVRRMV